MKVSRLRITSRITELTRGKPSPDRAHARFQLCEIVSAYLQVLTACPLTVGRIVSHKDQ